MVSLDDDGMAQVVHHAMAPELVALGLPLLHDPARKLLVQGAHIGLEAVHLLIWLECQRRHDAVGIYRLTNV